MPKGGMEWFVETQGVWRGLVLWPCTVENHAETTIKGYTLPAACLLPNLNLEHNKGGPPGTYRSMGSARGTVG